MFIVARISLESSPKIALPVRNHVKRSMSSIKIPPRIDRGPTDILKSLASTIGRDPTAAHYKYHDDPFLIPSSNTSKRSYALSQEAGRKAAKWIMNEHRELFQHKVAEPFIEAFAPKDVYDENSNVGEDTLVKVIADGQVGDSIIIYDILSTKKLELSEGTKQALLELLCFTNGEDGVDEEFIEERWFGQSKKGKNVDIVPKTWKDSGVAESVFKSMKSPSSAAYSAMIQGRAKFGQADRAWQLYEAAVEKGIVLDVGAFNALISVTNALKQSGDLRWQFIVTMLSSMSQAKIAPNLGTLNSVLSVLTNIGLSKSVDYALSTLSEFRNLGVEPSLGSYALLLYIYTRDRNSASNVRNVLAAILGQIEQKEFMIRHPTDVVFFVKAMEVCRNYAHDSDIARRIDDLLHHSDNYNLIGDSYSESVYYRHYFMLLCSTESFENIMASYNAIVPHLYIPEPVVAQELLKSVNDNGEIEFIPQLWSDIVTFDLADREQVLSQLLDCLINNEPAPDSPLIDKFADIAFQIWTNIQNQPLNRSNVVSWTGETLSNVLMALTRAKRLDEASAALDKIATEQSYIGEPKIDALCSYIDLCIERKDCEKALVCLRVCKEIGFVEVLTMAKDVRSRLTLTDEQAVQLAEIIGGE